MYDLMLSVCCEFRDPTIRRSQSGWLNNLLHNLGISLQTLFSHQQIPSEQEQFDFNPCFLMFWVGSCSGCNTTAYSGGI